MLPSIISLDAGCTTTETSVVLPSSLSAGDARPGSIRSMARCNRLDRLHPHVVAIDGRGASEAIR